MLLKTHPARCLGAGSEAEAAEAAAAREAAEASSPGAVLRN